MLGACFKFAVQYGSTTATLSDEVRDELWIIAALLPVLGTDLGRPFATIAFSSDASLRGYALHSTAVSADLVAGAVGLKERWRFREPQFAGSVAATFARETARHTDAPLGDFDQWADAVARTSGSSSSVAYKGAPPGAVAGASGLRGLAVDAPTWERLQVLDSLLEPAESAELFVPVDSALLVPSRWQRELVGAWNSPGAIQYKEARIAVKGAGARRAKYTLSFYSAVIRW